MELKYSTFRSGYGLSTGWNDFDGAAVLPAYRGRDIYRMMISKRKQDARKNGLEELIIHAVKNTSAPISEKIGFRKVCEINFYSYIVESWFYS